MCASQTYKKWIYITGKTLTTKWNPALNSVKTIDCQPHAKRFEKHLKPGLKHLHAPTVCANEHLHPTYFSFC